MKVNFRPTIPQIVLSAVALVLFVGAFIGVSSLISSWCLTPLPGDPIGGCSGQSSTNNPTFSNGTQIAPPPTPEPTANIPEVELPPAWDGASRVNILVMGLDSDAGVDAEGRIVPADSPENVLPRSADRNGPPRSDTMIVLTIDPQTMTAGMVSIPRDLWVNIPGFGYSRINTAYQDGEGAKLPGGGPALAMKTVEQVLGVPIQYYAQVDFWAFSKFIDDIGKIWIDIPKKIIIDPIGPGGDNWMLSAGGHWLNGSRALAYVRNRHTENGDVDRSQRQQDVIFAIRERMLSPENLPSLISNAPYLYNDIQSGIHTNLTFDQMMRLGMLAKDIPLDKIKRGVINNSMVIPARVTLGGEAADVLKPIYDKIRELRDEIFSSSGAISPMAQGDDDPLGLVKQENASVIVLNSTFTQGLAIQTGDYLKTQGINVINNGNADQNLAVTKVIDHTGRPYMLKYLKELFNLGSSSQITSAYDPNAAADIEIILGNDWASKNTLPK